MNKRLRHLRNDERGMSFVFVGLGFMAFMSATILAIDVGMLMTARAQAQTSADAGAARNLRWATTRWTGKRFLLPRRRAD